MHREVARVFAQDHPALEGHFPGNPVVPGVVILEEVFRGLVEVLGDIELVSFPRVKFLSPLRPGQPFTVCYTLTEPTEVSFTCTCAGRTLSQGRMEIRPRRDAEV
jgi:3-hydroxyacyl-[acyl-carrier-protein] dehydratase